MPKDISMRDHVIQRLYRTQNLHERPVTPREVYLTSSRDVGEFKAMLEELIEDGTVGTIPSPPGSRGRPTVYVYLKNEWIPRLDASPLDPTPPLVSTLRPGPFSDLGDHRSPEQPDHPALTDLPEDFATTSGEDLFTFVGPRMFLYAKSHRVTRTELIDAFAKDFAADDRHRIVVCAYRLSHHAYEEYYSKFRLVKEDTARKLTENEDGSTWVGTRDARRKEGVLVAPEEPPSDAELATKSGMMAQGQDQLGRIFGDYDGNFPAPNDDRPDVVRFEESLRAI